MNFLEELEVERKLFPEVEKAIFSCVDCQEVVPLGFRGERQTIHLWTEKFRKLGYCRFDQIYDLLCEFDKQSYRRFLDEAMHIDGYIRFLPNSKYPYAPTWRFFQSRIGSPENYHRWGQKRKSVTFGAEELKDCKAEDFFHAYRLDEENLRAWIYFDFQRLKKLIVEGVIDLTNGLHKERSSHRGEEFYWIPYERIIDADIAWGWNINNL
jgi:hypothetical protein